MGKKEAGRRREEEEDRTQRNQGKEEEGNGEWGLGNGERRSSRQDAKGIGREEGGRRKTGSRLRQAVRGFMSHCAAYKAGWHID